MSFNYTTYKQQLLLKLEKIQEKIAVLAEEEKELDNQLKIHCEKLQRDICLGNAEIEALRARNRIKKQVLNLKNSKSYNTADEKASISSEPQESIRSKSRKEIGWKLAYNYSRNHHNTPTLDRNKLNSWVETVTKNCAKNIRQINQCILAGDIKELEKLTGFTSVEKVSNYVNDLVSNIEKLANFFNMLGEIRAVHTAFKMIVEEFEATGFYKRQQSKSYKNYSRYRREQSKSYKDYSRYGREQGKSYEEYSSHRRNTRNRPQKGISRKDFPIFAICQSLKEAKEKRKKMSIENHPDLGGSEEKMKQINHQYDLFVSWIEKSTPHNKRT